MLLEMDLPTLYVVDLVLHHNDAIVRVVCVHSDV